MNHVQLKGKHFLIILIGLFFFLGFTLTTCDDDSKQPLLEVLEPYADKPNLSLILADMEADNFDNYQHKYRILVAEADTILTDTTDWVSINRSFFLKHRGDLGMELAHKKDGVLRFQTVPAGYNNYVGNPRYGHWEERNGESFWSFYGKFAFMNAMFNMLSNRRSYWNDYQSHYASSSNNYYGPAGNRVAGTDQYLNSDKGKQSTWGRKSSSFRDKFEQKSQNFSKQRRSRSDSRYRGRSSRSRSGGFGK